MLRLARLTEDFDHTIARLFDSELGVRGTKVVSSRIAEISLHPARVHDKRIQPRILAVDAYDEPVDHCLSSTIGGVGDWRLVTARCQLTYVHTN